MNTKELDEKIKIVTAQLESLKKSKREREEKEKRIKSIDLCLDSIKDWQTKVLEDGDYETYYKDFVFKVKRVDDKTSFNIDGLIVEDLLYGDEINNILEALKKTFEERLTELKQKVN